MSPYRLIQLKRDGGTLPPDMIEQFIGGYVDGHIPDYQMSAFLMAVFFRGMTAEETSALTKTMMDSGERFLPEDFAGMITADKHSTGGVGDKISLILAPLVAATGIGVPMMSGRGLGHTGGTLDKLESIPGFNTRLNRRQLLDQMQKIGVAMIGQTDTMVPADKKMYALRDVTATVDCLPLIAASIMSKKIAAGPQNLILDVKVGRGAFMKSQQDAAKLAKTMVDIGTAHGRNVQAILTNMHTQPLGRAVGNSLEVMESVDVLTGKGSKLLRELTIVLSAPLLIMAGYAPDEHSAITQLNKLIDDGTAYEIFKKLVETQGGDVSSIEPPYSLPLGKPVVLKSSISGVLSGIDPMIIGLASIELGAGRKRQDDSIDPGVGFLLHAEAGDTVQKGDALVTVFTAKPLPESLKTYILSAFEFDQEPSEFTNNLVLDRISPGS
ncbi:thymidine phosphorylase [bacterium]|nr:thymidine phosphorylase [candidate division CSSED10-310 bacterium]